MYWERYIQTQNHWRRSQADDMQAGSMYRTIRISVTALNVFNSKVCGLGRGIEGAVSLCWCCLFSRFASLPGVWHWLELVMNVTYSNPRNWPTPGNPSILQWKFSFSKPISCSGRAPERPICQHWQWICVLLHYSQKNIHKYTPSQWSALLQRDIYQTKEWNCFSQLVMGLKSFQIFAWMSLISLQFGRV